MSAGLPCEYRNAVVLEREVYDRLSRALHCPLANVKALVTELGEAASRWRAEQKVATAAAWLVLARR